MFNLFIIQKEMHNNAFQIERNKLPQICNSNTINEIISSDDINCNISTRNAITYHIQII